MATTPVLPGVQRNGAAVAQLEAVKPAHISAIEAIGARRVLGIWLLLRLAIIVDGIVRRAVFEPRLNATAVEVIANALGVVIVLGVTRPFLRRFAG
jgi:hypothetical protein